MDLRLDEATGKTLMGASRSVAMAGVASSIEEARELSLEGVKALKGPFRYRRDVGSAADIAKSREHLLAIRRAERTRAP
jgi:phosphoribosylamine-glycine ligase